jgi:hypothetical protein
MNKLVLAILAISLMAGCKSQKNHSNKDEYTFEDFQQLFRKDSLPYKLNLDSLGKKVVEADTISGDMVDQFLLDTLGRSDFPEGTDIEFYPLAQIGGAAVNYFVVKGVGAGITIAYVCFFDKKGNYLSRLAAAKTEKKSNEEQYFFSIDKKQVIKVTNEKLLSPGHTARREDFYGVSDDGKVTLIMTNSNGEAAAGQIFNPIDTLRAKHKFSGDYHAGETSLVSIRDGKDGKSFSFFISFSKDKNACKGELSGIGYFAGTNKGEYKDKETGCGLTFQFSTGHVSLKETGGCGGYRGVRCFFEGSFSKKK